MRYYSQIDQDYLLDVVVFQQMRDGVFVDVGAHDGVSFSNTAFFERERNWSGICIEPNPEMFPLLLGSRSATCVNVAAGSCEGTLPFIQVTGYGNMLSGVETTMSEAHRMRIRRAIREHSDSKKIIDFPMQPLRNLLHDLSEVHYMSVDTEGNEADALRSVDFDACMIHVITVEANCRDAIAPLLNLTAKHFEFVGQHKTDLFLINRRSRFLSHQSHLRRLLTGPWKEVLSPYARARRMIARWRR
jgi:FkbM family methyltransferase